MQKAQILTHSQLAHKLASLKGSSFIYIETDSMFKDMNKRGNPFFNEVRKHTQQTLLVGFNYGNAVNNRLKKLGKEADFQPKERSWGRKIGNALVEHKGSLYIEAQAITCFSSRYVQASDNKTPISKEELKPFFNAKKRKENKETLLTDIQDKEEEEVLDWACQHVHYGNYSFSSITQIHMEGKAYVLVEDSKEATEITIEELEKEFEIA